MKVFDSSVAYKGKNMKTIKIADLTELQLDWAVAKCEVAEPVGSFLDGVVPHPDYNNFHPSTDWAQGGTLIERENISVGYQGHLGVPLDSLWYATNRDDACGFGQTPLIAAMRCYCYAKLGEVVDIPEDVK